MAKYNVIYDVITREGISEGNADCKEVVRQMGITD